ncbi:hypothetical protein HA464_03180 [Rhizobium leguminosarum bv. trifolii]|uniref:hypothetical protein n=1 Tax=Rhizobium ruizarguesonis TaxID=2081791 RepID=UPI0010324433|nr:hypothetical protein [Rhizobium ruizarguesonis]QIO43082.1 hypothetical protein HA464_03180 [Rhizobium leguminosarum bv. trifolii]TAZ19518.1 hypothetical protein ELH77_12440 [Rhizobium ruizarguesonis]
MTENDNADWFDPDIAAMGLSYGEKAGLQIYRNYTRSFEKRAIELFVAALNELPFDTVELERFSSLLVTEEPRFLPIITCAFADDLLVVAFKHALPDFVPGGKKELFGGYGPLSSFSQRIKLAVAFNVVSPDLALELDKVRSVRNKLSHSWDVSDFNVLLKDGKLATIEPVESYMAEREQFKDRVAQLDELGRLRLRLVWIVCRLAYEAHAYHRCKEANLDPSKVLYGTPATIWLRSVAKISLDASNRIMKATG